MSALVKRELPRYVGTLPVSKSEFSYRPYTVKEERIISMAASITGDDADKQKYAAVYQIVENCTDIDMSQAHPTDVEYAFLQIRKTSNSNKVEVTYFVPLQKCGLEAHQIESECAREIKASFLIDHIETEMSDLTDIAEQRPNGSWIIELLPDLHLQLTIRALDPDGPQSAIYQMLDAVIDGENVITKDQFTAKEFTTFIEESLQPKAMEKLGEFVSKIPSNKVTITPKCPKCKKEFTYTTAGITSFLV